MLADQIVDLAITHAPAAERRALNAHPDWQYRKFAFNRFAIVGPHEDPAEVRHAADAAEAFRRIAASPITFVSRGDQSGTHEREIGLWRAAGRQPAADRLLVSGASMAVTLRHADERQGYTLADEATFRQLQSQVDLVTLLTDDPMLLNTYAVIYPRDNAPAAAFAEWLTAGEGRQRLSMYRISGLSALHVWPKDCVGDDPEAMPCADHERPPHHQ